MCISDLPAANAASSELTICVQDLVPSAAVCNAKFPAASVFVETVS